MLDARPAEASPVTVPTSVADALKGQGTGLCGATATSATPGIEFGNFTSATYNGSNVATVGSWTVGLPMAGDVAWTAGGFYGATPYVVTYVAGRNPVPQDLVEAALLRVRELAGPHVVLPSTLEELIATLEPIYTGFDMIAPIVIMTRSTPQGRALRKSQNKPRVAAYTAALAEAVKDLPKEDRKLATAMIQVLHTTPWLEMRDHWGLDGRQIARATGWAVRTLLRDLKQRGGTPLDRDPPEAAPGEGSEAG